MPEDTIAWKPAAMSRVESTDEVPKGFQRLVFVGIGLTVVKVTGGICNGQSLKAAYQLI